MVRDDGKGHCAGTLVSRKIVVTAAHCVCHTRASLHARECVLNGLVTGVIVGDHNQLKEDDGEMYIKPSSTIGHEKSFAGNLILIS